jgi:hypothetical protein
MQFITIATTLAISAFASAQVVSQISDGQIQATTATKTSTLQVVSQISDGQIQATTATQATKTSTVQVVSQISDGQVQATTATVITQTGAADQVKAGAAIAAGIAMLFI